MFVIFLNTTVIFELHFLHFLANTTIQIHNTIFVHFLPNTEPYKSILQPLLPNNLSTILHILSIISTILFKLDRCSRIVLTITLSIRIVLLTLLLLRDLQLYILLINLDSQQLLRIFYQLIINIIIITLHNY